MFSNELKLYQRSKDFLWTDEHISKNMLAAHLDPNHDAASRNINTIEKTIEWIAQRVPKGGRIIDLGCGPGLYASILAKKGYEVTAIDISQRSISYAKKKALEDNLKIDYHCKDYINDDLGQGYDAAICIYCDFGALIPNEQERLLKIVSGILSKDGIFIFDVFKHGICDDKREYRDWYYSEESDFWCDGPHFVLEENKHFVENKAWASRTLILQDGVVSKEYITWDLYYTEESIKELLVSNGFYVKSVKHDIVEKNKFTSNDVMFIEAIRN